MRPTIGRVVHFQPVGSRPPEHAPRAALITALRDEGAVDLTVFDPQGFHFWRAVPFSPHRAPGRWSWPAREAAS